MKLSIHEIIKTLIVREGTSMRKILKEMTTNGYKSPKSSNLSTMFKNETIKYKLVADILDYLGYKITIEKK